jgi:hypothetical protein
MSAEAAQLANEIETRNSLSGQREAVAFSALNPLGEGFRFKTF